LLNRTASQAQRAELPWLNHNQHGSKFFRIFPEYGRIAYQTCLVRRKYFAGRKGYIINKLLFFIELQAFISLGVKAC
jgi:hypothetical protein